MRICIFLSMLIWPAFLVLGIPYLFAGLAGIKVVLWAISSVFVIATTVVLIAKMLANLL